LTKSWKFLAAAVLLVVLGPVGLLLGISSRAVRDAPFVFMGVSVAGVLLAMAHARARRSVLSFFAAFLLAAVTALFVYGTVVSTRVPDSGAVPRAGDAAPAFSISISIDGGAGASVTRDDLVANGPRVLVFFRGTW
jgi:hypothetical protein